MKTESERKLNFKVLTAKERRDIMALYFLQNKPIQEIATLTEISPITLYKWKMEYQDKYESLKANNDQRDNYLKGLDDRIQVALQKAKKAKENDKRKPVKQESESANVSKEKTVKQVVKKEENVSPVVKAKIREVAQTSFTPLSSPTQTSSSEQESHTIILKQYDLILSLVQSQQKMIDRMNTQHNTVLAYEKIKLEEYEERIKQLENENLSLKALLKKNL